MTELSFQDLTFIEEKEQIKVIFLDHFHFFLKKDDLLTIGRYKISSKSIFFDLPEKRASTKFGRLLTDGFATLKSNITGYPAVYVHQNSGIPLIGSGSFGIVDRNTSLIEIKPITGCNLDCCYCSVDQNRRITDFVVEKDYLVRELAELIKYKEIDEIEVHIGCQGEPLLYSPLLELITDIKKILHVTKISMDTNGVLLNPKRIDEFIEAGLTSFNLSINSLDEDTSKQIAGKGYSINKILEIAEYISKKKALMITPVLLPGINDQEIEKLIDLSKKLNCRIGIQNFLPYKFGKNPVEGITFEKFYEKLEILEKQKGIKLILSEEDFNIRKTKPLKKPFDKDDVIKAQIICAGRMSRERYAVAKNRLIAIPNCLKESGTINVRIVRSKHNIFVGTP